MVCLVCFALAGLWRLHLACSLAKLASLVRTVLGLLDLRRQRLARSLTKLTSLVMTILGLLGLGQGFFSFPWKRFLAFFSNFSRAILFFSRAILPFFGVFSRAKNRLSRAKNWFFSLFTGNFVFHGQKFEFFKVSRATFVLSRAIFRGFFTGKVLFFTGKKKNTGLRRRRLARSLVELANSRFWVNFRKIVRKTTDTHTQIYF